MDSEISESFRVAALAQLHSTKMYSRSHTGPTVILRDSNIRPMARMPNQIDGEHTGLLEQIARCRRLAKEVSDEETVRRLLALAIEYEQELSPPAQPQ